MFEIQSEKGRNAFAPLKHFICKIYYCPAGGGAGGAGGGGADDPPGAGGIAPGPGGIPGLPGGVSGACGAGGCLKTNQYIPTIISTTRIITTAATAGLMLFDFESTFAIEFTS